MPRTLLAAVARRRRASSRHFAAGSLTLDTAGLELYSAGHGTPIDAVYHPLRVTPMREQPIEITPGTWDTTFALTVTVGAAQIVHVYRRTVVDVNGNGAVDYDTPVTVVLADPGVSLTQSTVDPGASWQRATTCFVLRGLTVGVHQITLACGTERVTVRVVADAPETVEVNGVTETVIPPGAGEPLPDEEWVPSSLDGIARWRTAANGAELITRLETEGVLPGDDIALTGAPGDYALALGSVSNTWFLRVPPVALSAIGTRKGWITIRFANSHLLPINDRLLQADPLRAQLPIIVPATQTQNQDTLLIDKGDGSTTVSEAVQFVGVIIKQNPTVGAASVRCCVDVGRTSGQGLPHAPGEVAPGDPGDPEYAGPYTSVASLPTAPLGTKYQPVVPAECPLDTRMIHCYLDSGITPYGKDNLHSTATVAGAATFDSATNTTTIPIDGLPVGVANGYLYRIRRTGTGRNGLYWPDAYVQRALGGASVGPGLYGLSASTTSTISTVSSVGRPDPAIPAVGDVVEFYAGTANRMLLRGYYATARRLVIHAGEILNACHTTGDAQGYEQFNGPGPVQFSDVAVLGPFSEPFHIGGAETRSDAMVPRDLSVERCHFNTMGHMPKTYGGFYVLKNLGEMKIGQRARFRRLVVDGMPVADGQQYGVAFNLKEQVYGRTADVPAGGGTFADRRILTATTSHVSIKDVIVRRTAGVASFVASQLGNSDNVTGLDMDGYVMAHHLAVDNVVHMQPLSTAEFGSGGVAAPFTVSGSRSPTNEVKMPRSSKMTRITSMSQQRQGTSSGSVFGTPTLALYGGGPTTDPKMHTKNFQFTQNIVRCAVLGGSAGNVSLRLFTANPDDLSNANRNAGIDQGGSKEILTGTSSTLGGNYVVNSLTNTGSAFVTGAIGGNTYDPNDAATYSGGVGQFVGDPVNSATLSDYALHPAVVTASGFTGGPDMARLAFLTAGIDAI